MGKIVLYPENVKWKAVELRKEGYTYKAIQEELGIKNKRQIQKWMKWYQDGQTYRFSQGIGKQYSYGKGIGELSEVAQLKMENKHLNSQVEILKKYKEIERSWYLKL